MLDLAGERVGEGPQSAVRPITRLIRKNGNTGTSPQLEQVEHGHHAQRPRSIGASWRLKVALHQIAQQCCGQQKGRAGRPRWKANDTSTVPCASPKMAAACQVPSTAAPGSDSPGPPAHKAAARSAAAQQGEPARQGLQRVSWLRNAATRLKETLADPAHKKQAHQQGQTGSSNSRLTIIAASARAAAGAALPACSRSSGRPPGSDQPGGSRCKQIAQRCGRRRGRAQLLVEVAVCRAQPPIQLIKLAAQSTEGPRFRGGRPWLARTRAW